jgi:hypothetical protein
LKRLPTFIRWLEAEDRYKRGEIHFDVCEVLTERLSTLFPHDSRPVRTSKPPSRDGDSTVRDLIASSRVSDYVINPIGSSHGREIGRGGSSRVRVVRDPDTGNLIAVKYFSSPNLDTTGFIHEVESLVKLNHPCLLRILHWVLPKRPNCAEIHTEYASRGSLDDFLSGRKAPAENAFWTPTRTAIVICDIVLGMRFVHFRELIHRDAKRSNILIRHNGRALIGDFGSSRFESDATITGQSATVH